MNIFRLCGDMLHVSSIMLLLYKLHKNKSCIGISCRTQERLAAPPQRQRSSAFAMAPRRLTSCSNPRRSPASRTLVPPQMSWCRGWLIRTPPAHQAGRIDLRCPWGMEGGHTCSSERRGQRVFFAPLAWCVGQAWICHPKLVFPGDFSPGTNVRTYVAARVVADFPPSHGWPQLAAHLGISFTLQLDTPPPTILTDQSGVEDVASTRRAKFDIDEVDA